MVLRACSILFRWSSAALIAAALGWAALPAGAYDRYSGYDGCRRDAFWDGACSRYTLFCLHPDHCQLEPLSPPRHRWREEPRYARPDADRHARRTPPTPERRAREEDDDPAEPPAETEPDRRADDAEEAPDEPAENVVNARREAAENGEIPQRYRDMRNTVGHTLSAIRRGAEHYQRHCAACHGDTGVGDGPRAQQSSPDMPNLRFTVDQGYADDAYLIWTIMEGGERVSTGKPGFADTLSRRQAWQIIAYMRAGFPQSDSRRTAQRMMPSGNGDEDDSEDR